MTSDKLRVMGTRGVEVPGGESEGNPSNGGAPSAPATTVAAVVAGGPPGDTGVGTHLISAASGDRDADSHPRSSRGAP